MKLSQISRTWGPVIIIAGIIITGCATQQKTTSDPAQTQPESTQKDQKENQGTAKPAAAQPQAEQEDRREAQNTEKSAAAQLEAARKKLQVSQDTEKRVQAEYQKLQQSGQASKEISEDYETYLNRVQALVSENSELVEKLEAAMAVSAQGPQKSGSAKETGDETAQLDRQLNQALSEFDEMLLKEIDLIKATSEPKMTSLAEEAAAAADRLRKKGIDVGSANEEEQPSPQGDTTEEAESTGEKAAKGSSGQSGERQPGDDEGQGSETEDGRTGSKQAKSETGGDATGTRSDDRSRGYSEDDDDIVARQLREAAEKETDPELKQKLWKEYEDYKRNTGQ